MHFLKSEKLRTLLHRQYYPPHYAYLDIFYVLYTHMYDARHLVPAVQITTMFPERESMGEK